MTEWVLRISAAAVALTVSGYILPKGGVKNAAMLAMGFLFLTILLPPLGNLAESFINERAVLEAEKNMLASQIDDDKALGDIMKNYKERISDEITSALNSLQVSCSNISINVDESPDSETFGYVLAVNCEIYAAQPEQSSGQGIDKVTVPEIIIDFSGIHIESDSNEENEKNEYIESVTRKAADTIASVTGADKNNIHVKWSGVK